MKLKASFPITLKKQAIDAKKIDLKGVILEKINHESPLDRFDRMMIEILSTEGRLPVTDLARRVGLSKSPCQARLKRLRSEGYILGFRAVINQERLGRDHVAFTEVKLSDTTENALRAFNTAVLAMPEVEQCHMIAGRFDYLLKVRTNDIKAYRAFLAEKISRLPFIANTSTYVSMQAVKETAA